MNNTEKHLSRTEYLDALQREYFICECRHAFYSHYKDKVYYKKVMTHKKEKIQSLCEYMGGVINIFNDEDQKEFYKNKIISKEGRILFEMNDEDTENYYAPNCDVKFDIGGGKYDSGKLISIDLENNMTTVKVRHGKEKLIMKKFIIRVL